MVQPRGKHFCLVIKLSKIKHAAMDATAACYVCVAIKSLIWKKFLPLIDFFVFVQFGILRYEAKLIAGIQF